MEDKLPDMSEDQKLLAGSQEPTGIRAETPHELYSWIRTQGLDPQLEAALIAATDYVFERREQLWRSSKEEGLQALSVGNNERINRLRDELHARDATVSRVAAYFEDLVADLTDQGHRDPKTNLLNFKWFTEQLEAYLALHQRSFCCAVGWVDIDQFTWYNDNIGHLTGDKIINQVARLLEEQVRPESRLARPELRHGERRSGDNPVPPGEERRHEEQRVAQALHGRFGGDEFCFLIPDLDDFAGAWVIAERFRDTVKNFDWTTKDPRLAEKPVSVSVGMVCLELGDVVKRRWFARSLAQDLLELADQQMYAAKEGKTEAVRMLQTRIENGTLVNINDDTTA